GARRVEGGAVVRDVARAGRQRGALESRDRLGAPLGQGDAPGAQADEGDVLGAAVLFEDLVGDTCQRAVERRLVEDFGLFTELRRATAHFRSLRASRGTLKGVHCTSD